MPQQANGHTPAASAASAHTRGRSQANSEGSRVGRFGSDSSGKLEGLNPVCWGVFPACLNWENLPPARCFSSLDEKGHEGPARPLPRGRPAGGLGDWRVPRNSRRKGRKMAKLHAELHRFSCYCGKLDGNTDADNVIALCGGPRRLGSKVAPFVTACFVLV